MNQLEPERVIGISPAASSAISASGRTIALACGGAAVVQKDGVQSIMLNHSNISAVALSSDARVLAVADAGYVTLYNKEEVGYQAILKIEVHSISDVAFSANDNLLAMAGAQLIILRMDTGELIPVVGQQPTLGTSRTSANVMNRQFVIWLQSTHAQSSALYYDGRALQYVTVAFSRASLSFTAQQSLIYTGPEARVWVGAAHIDEKAVVVSSRGDVMILVPKNNTLEPVKAFPSLAVPASHATGLETPNGLQLLVCGTSADLIMVRDDAASVEDHFSLPGSVTGVTKLVDSFAVATSVGVVMEVEKGKGEKVLIDAPASTPKCLVTGYQERPDIVVLGTSTGVELWSLDSFNTIAHAQTKAPVSCVSCVGERVWAGTSDGTIYCFEGLGLTNILTIMEAHKGEIRTIAPSQDNALCATGGVDCVIRIWNNIGTMECYTAGHSAPITALYWDAVVPTLIHSSANDRTIACHQLCKDGGDMRRVKYRLLSGASSTALTQLDVGDCEVVSADSSGVLRLFDFDIDGPTLVTQPPDAPSPQVLQWCSGLLVHMCGMVNGGATVCLYRVGNEGLERVCEENLGIAAKALALTTDAKQIIAIGGENEVVVFDVFMD